MWAALVKNSVLGALPMDMAADVFATTCLNGLMSHASSFGHAQAAGAAAATPAVQLGTTRSRTVRHGEIRPEALALLKEEVAD